MSVLALIENWEGDFKKTSFEALHYAKQISNHQGQKLIAITFGAKTPKDLENYGADKIVNISNLKFENTSNHIISEISAELISEYEADKIVISNTITGKTIGTVYNTTIIMHTIIYLNEIVI